MPETPQATDSVSTESSAVPKRDFRQEVTSQIIEMLEKGTAPWQTPWNADALHLPFNPTTDRTYRGGNALHLMAVGARKGFDDPRWLTYRQAQESGWQVRKGEKGSQIEFWQFDAGSKASPDQGDSDPSRNEDRRENASPIHRVYTVFNARQLEGIPAYVPKQRQEWEIVETGESILKNAGAQIQHDQRDRAFYNRAADAIHLPRQEAAERGIPHNPEQHAAYVGPWITALQNDKNEIFRAAKDAHKAADFILSLDKSKPTEKTAAQLRTETSEHVADFERGSSTVNIVEKETATEHREPVPTAWKRQGSERDQDAKIDAEKILDGEVDGRKAPSDREFEQSLAEADRKAKQLLGDKARVSEPDTESGRYRGTAVAESDHHVIQKLSPRSAVAHSKHLLPQSVQPGDNLVISYSNGIAQLKPNQIRERTQALSR